jgi:lysozyme
MGLFGWLRAWVRRDAVPPPAADMLGAATLPPSEKNPKSKPDQMLPHVVIDTRGRAVPEECVELVAKWEGFREDAYLCPAGVWTIGYGTTRWPDGRRVKSGEKITRKVADGMMRLHLRDFASEVDRLVDVPLTTHERAALISFTYNVGSSAFASSTLRKLLNEGDRAGAAEQFRRWNKAGGQVSQGLINRRAEEAAMFRGVA